MLFCHLALWREKIHSCLHFCWYKFLCTWNIGLGSHINILSHVRIYSVKANAQVHQGVHFIGVHVKWTRHCTKAQKSLLLFENIRGGERRQTPHVVDSVLLNFGRLSAPQAGVLVFDSKPPSTGQKKEGKEAFNLCL